MRYTEEFKREAVQLTLEGGVSKSRVARDLGININSLSAWIRKHRDGVGEEKPLSLEEENRKLRRELSIIKQERDILKKAAAYFAKEQF